MCPFRILNDSCFRLLDKRRLQSFIQYIVFFFSLNVLFRRTFDKEISNLYFNRNTWVCLFSL